MNSVQRRILVVEDERTIAEAVAARLRAEGFAVESAHDGPTAVAKAKATNPDLVVLDIMLPGLDGIEVCRRLRAGAPELPILMLTARGRVPDRIAGLDAGADDYLVKPFDFDELLARIRALLRRSHSPEDARLRFRDLSLDPTTRDVQRGERHIELTTREYELLELLLRHPRQVLSRDSILERVWGADFRGDSNLIDVHVMRLRDKLEAGSEPRLIQTIRGAGYSLRGQ